jgi:hypothetical protein
MKKRLFSVLIGLLAFTAGTTLSWVTGWFGADSTPKVAEVTQVETVQLPIPPPPPPIPVTSTPKAIEILDYDVEKFSPEGTYELSGKKPKGLEEFSYFSIYPGDTTATPVTMGVLKAEYEYVANNTVFALVTSKRIVFVTEPFENGFEYRFEGQFLRGKLLMDYPEGTVVLQGTLTKSRNGRTVAEATVKFKMVFDHC